MGCNYYWRYNYCKCCNRYDEYHIGKSSHGWSFSFHGIKNDKDIPNINSYNDWLKCFEDNDGQIFDEYGRNVSVDEFKNLVYTKRKGLNHTTYCQKSENYLDKRYGNEMCILDNEGYSFNYGDFT